MRLEMLCFSLAVAMGCDDRGDESSSQVTALEQELFDAGAVSDEEAAFDVPFFENVPEPLRGPTSPTPDALQGMAETSLTSAFMQAHVVYYATLQAGVDETVYESVNGDPVEPLEYTFFGFTSSDVLKGSIPPNARIMYFAGEESTPRGEMVIFGLLDGSSVRAILTLPVDSDGIQVGSETWSTQQLGLFLDGTHSEKEAL